MWEFCGAFGMFNFGSTQRVLARLLEIGLDSRSRLEDVIERDASTFCDGRGTPPAVSKRSSSSPGRPWRTPRDWGRPPGRGASLSPPNATSRTSSARCLAPSARDTRMGARPSARTAASTGATTSSRSAASGRTSANIKTTRSPWSQPTRRSSGASTPARPRPASRASSRSARWPSRRGARPSRRAATSRTATRRSRPAPGVLFRAARARNPFRSS